MNSQIIAKMKLRIGLFKGLKNVEYEFKDGLLILLSGRSGIGKSTLFEAFYWLLYGKLRGIAPHDAPNASCHVRLSYLQYEIIRKTRSNLLTIQSPGVNLVDSAAQGLIDELFGSKEIFELTGYLPQDGYSPLITGSNKDRLNYLHRLSFSHDDPIANIKIIKTQLKEYESGYQREKERFDLRRTELTSEIERLGVNKKQPSITEIDQQLAQLGGEIVDLERALRSNQADEVSKTIYQKSIDELISTNSRITVSSENIDQLTSKLAEIDQRIREHHELFTKLNQLKNQSQGLWERRRRQNDARDALLKAKARAVALEQQLKEGVTPIDDREYLSYQAKYRDYEHCSKVTQKYGLPYSKEAIEGALRNAELVAGLKTKLGTYQRWGELKKVIPEGDLENQIDSLRRQLDEAIRASERLRCPHCKRSVYYQQRQLIPADSPKGPTLDVKSTEQRLRQLQENQKQNEKTKVELEHYQSFLQPSLALLERYQAKDIDRSVELVKELSSLKYTEAPRYLPEELELMREQFRLSCELRELRKKITENEAIVPFGDDQLITSLDEEIVAIEKIVTSFDLHSGQQQRVLLERRIQQQRICENNLAAIAELERKIGQLKIDPSLSSEYRQKREQFALLERNKVISEQVGRLRLRRQELEVERIALEEKRVKLIALIEYYKNATELQCLCLEDTVETINYWLSKMVGELIEEVPISVSLHLFKEVRSSKKIKPYVCMKMSYCGTEVDGIESLSKGQLKRLSLAFMIALNGITNNPIILLDEIGAYLDSENLEKSLEIIKELIGNDKTVICASHRDVAGHYDDEIELN